MSGSQAGPAPRRALILAGGGLKVAYQAGVMQVWLDEAGLRFDHADGASGGCLNLAMYAQGMSGRRIAQNWREFEPLRGVHVSVPDLVKLAFARSLFTLDNYRRNVFPRWGLDWPAIRASTRVTTFNYYNFSRMRLETVEAAAMDEDRLVACVSLPMWFPPVAIDGDTCIDAVYNTDANIEEAIRRGADELWIIWTVGETGRWADGFVNNYFQVIEVAADGRLRDVLARIARNNAALEAGGPGEFGRRIAVAMLKSEVDLNYILDADQDRFAEAVNKGVRDARAWCSARSIAFQPLPDPPGAPPGEAVALSFAEVMKGFVAFGATDFDAGYRRGEAEDASLRVDLTVSTEDVARFVTHPQHEAAVAGSIVAAALGGSRPIRSGSFNLLVDTEDPARKLMTYRLVCDDANGAPVTLVGFKDVRSGPHDDVWTATTTLFTRLLRGAVRKEDDDAADILAAGIIRIHFLDFMEELSTFRVHGAGLPERMAALRRFASLFLGKLWDVYASRILPSSPV